MLEEVRTVRKVVNFLAGFLVGGLVGGAAGLLLAPYAGTELKEQVRLRVEGLVQEGQKAATARRAELEAQLEAFKSGEAVTIEETQEPA
jgi:gas vesicle protein